MTRHLSRLIEAFAGLDVVVIGEAMLDTYLDGTTGRLCREAPVPIVALSGRRDSPGGAANTAVNARSLGARVRFLSVIGDDGDGDRLRASLAARGVDPDDLLVEVGRQTLAKTRVVAAGQLLVRFDGGTTSPVSAAIEAELIDRLTRSHAEAAAVIVSDYGYGIMTPRVIAFLADLQERNPRVLVVDAKDLPAYRRAAPRP